MPISLLSAKVFPIVNQTARNFPHSYAVSSKSFCPANSHKFRFFDFAIYGAFYRTSAQCGFWNLLKILFALSNSLDSGV